MSLRGDVEPTSRPLDHAAQLERRRRFVVVVVVVVGTCPSCPTWLAHVAVTLERRHRFVVVVVVAGTCPSPLDHVAVTSPLCCCCCRWAHVCELCHVAGPRVVHGRASSRFVVVVVVVVVCTCPSSSTWLGRGGVTNGLSPRQRSTITNYL